MYAYKEKFKAMNLYFTDESYAAVITELGYPSRFTLRNWLENDKQYMKYGPAKVIIIMKSHIGVF